VADISNSPESQGDGEGVTPGGEGASKGPPPSGASGPDGGGSGATGAAAGASAAGGSGGSGSGVTRRQALAGAGGVGAFVVGGAVGYAVRGSGKSSSKAATTSSASTAASASTSALPSAADPTVSEADLRSPTILPLRFFSAADALVIGAMSDRIYPSDALGPGATELGVVQYIDRQLSGAWGTGERMYRQGPFMTPVTTGHGWQYALTPSDAYRVAIDSLATYTQANYGGLTYDELKPAQQDTILNALLVDKVPTFTVITGTDFMTMFLENVKEGIFADPSYGGNRAVEGWTLVGYPGDPMAYGDDQFKYVTDYTYTPPGPPRPLIASATEASA
jgi:gluconate 2-dehydrogenase gamma chain